MNEALRVKEILVTHSIIRTLQENQVPPRGNEISTSLSLDQSNVVAPHKQLQFQFHINSLSATLYSGESTLVSKKQIT